MGNYFPYILNTTALYPGFHCLFVLIVSGKLATDLIVGPMKVTGLFPLVAFKNFLCFLFSSFIMMSLGVDFLKLLPVEFIELLALGIDVFHQFRKVFKHFIFCPILFLFSFETSSHILNVLDIQNVVHWSAAASPGSTLQMQNLRFHPRPTKSESEF